ncbi:MAG: helix-turn-helix transcriptional regulator [Propionibacterium sp.]|nr:helix-turn-helix transcriptional regulator [Propionibacterium sp.]
MSRERSGLNRSQLAKLAGVPASTISRIEKGDVQPSTEMLNRVLAPLGRAASITPTSTPEASAAARAACDPSYPGDLDRTAQDLLGSWGRIGLIEGSIAALGKDRDVLYQASRLDSVAARQGAVRFAPRRDWIAAAEALERVSGLAWALTGGAAANTMVNVGGDEPQVFYVSDVALALDAGRLAALPSNAPGIRAWLVPFNGIWELGARTLSDGLNVADRFQIAVDCLSLGGAGPTQAEALLGAWV